MQCPEEARPAGGGAAWCVPAPRKPAGGHFRAAEKENFHAEALCEFCGLSGPSPGTVCLRRVSWARVATAWWEWT